MEWAIWRLGTTLKRSDDGLKELADGSLALLIQPGVPLEQAVQILEILSRLDEEVRF